MKIHRLDIEYFALDMLESDNCENLTHKKVLPYLSVVQVLEGGYDITVGDQPQQHIQNGGFFIASSGMQQEITHHMNPDSGRMRARWLFLDAVFNKTLRFDSCYDFPVVLPEEYREILHAAFEKLFSSDSLFQKYSCCYTVMDILTKAGKRTMNPVNEPMLRVFEFIRQNYRRPIKISDLANEVNMSESNFYPVFKKYFGLPPLSYINKFRISAAEEMLKNTNHTIKEIAASVGIDDPVYLNKLFHKNYRISPKEYRNKYKS